MSSGLYSQVLESSALVTDIMNGVRRQAEQADSSFAPDLDGFIQIHSPSGGAGSGLAKVLSERLYDDYRKKQNVSYLLFPSHQRKSQAMIVEPYNFTLSYNGLVRTCSIIVNFSNE